MFLTPRLALTLTFIFIILFLRGFAAASCGSGLETRRSRIGVPVDVDQGKVLVVVKRSAGVDRQTGLVQQVGIEHFQRDRFV